MFVNGFPQVKSVKLRAIKLIFELLTILMLRSTIILIFVHTSVYKNTII